MRPAGRRRQAPGFTLVEVLVAVAVVAVALIAGLQASAALGRQTQHQVEAIAAQWCAENALADLRLGQRLPDVGDEGFNCHQADQRLSGTLHTRPTPNAHFRLVTVEMRNEQGSPVLSLPAVVGNAP